MIRNKQFQKNEVHYLNEFIDIINSKKLIINKVNMIN